MEPPMLPRDLEPVVDLSDTGDGVHQVLCQPSGIAAVDCSRERHFAALDVQLDLAGVQIRTVGEQLPDFFVDLVIGAALELRAPSGLRATRLSPLRSTAAISPRHPQLSFGGRDYYACMLYHFKAVGQPLFWSRPDEGHRYSSRTRHLLRRPTLSGHGIHSSNTGKPASLRPGPHAQLEFRRHL